jgi:hypothetical protein
MSVFRIPEFKIDFEMFSERCYEYADRHNVTRENLSKN